MKEPGNLLLPWVLIMIGVFFGAMALIRMSGNPRLEGVRTVDEFQLISVGFCFGMAVSGILLLLREKMGRKGQ
jgi:hypothetical protein